MQAVAEAETKTKPIVGEDPTHDDPVHSVSPKPESKVDRPVTEEEENRALLLIRQTYKQSWADKRRALIRRILRAFEVLKNNPYSIYNEETGEFDSITKYLQNSESDADPELYQYNDNIYQMVCLAFIAALCNDVPKTRYQPVSADSEQDLLTAKNGSTIMAFVERLNDMPLLQKLELLYLWTSGSYYCYTRTIIDAARAGVTRVPRYEVANQVVVPERYLCAACGSMTPTSQLNAFQLASCQDCKRRFSPNDLRPAVEMPVPTQVGEDEQPNSMTAMDILSALNVDTNPDAQSIDKSPLLDYVVEADVASVRSSFSDKYDQISGGVTLAGDVSNDGEASMRSRVTAPSRGTAISVSSTQTTYSRCWIQPFAFNILNDRRLADHLTEKYPKGVKVVSAGNDIVLQKVEEALTAKWTHCATLPGMGMNPPGVGDAALDIQDRINDTANNVHIHMDRVAEPPTLYDADVIDGDEMEKNISAGASLVPVFRNEDAGVGRKPLTDLMFQPRIQIDAAIYSYGRDLVQLLQMIAGVQPQVFGGSDKNVQTAQGQNQMLQTAMGRMMIYVSQIRSERARRAKIAVLCTIDNMDDRLSIVVGGDVDGNYKNEHMLASELQGQFHTYPETDQGFPASYAEIQQRIFTILQQGQKNPFVAFLLNDPDAAKTVSRYVLPDGVKPPGDAMRTKVKLVLQELTQAQPIEVPAATGAVSMPSIMPERDVDDMGMIVQIAKTFLQENYRLQQTRPAGYENALAYLRLAAQYDEEAKIKSSMQASGAAPPGAPPAQGNA